VVIYAYGDRANVVVAVIDNGCGIPESEFERIFEWLYRGRNVSAVEGTGLGLAAVKAIMERHGGHVEVESVEGRGTVVTVQIPTQPVPAQ
jgi:signal transduction histidine kinase